MNDLNVDVVVVGGGPAGTITAKYAAMDGADVLLIEKRQEIGTPVRCGEGIAGRWLEEVGIKPDDRWLTHRVKGAKIISPDGSKLHIDEKIAGKEVGMVIERDVFDKNLARDAAKSGANIMVKTSAISLLKEGNKVVGVRAKHLGDEFDINANIVVGADGFESQIGRWGKIDTTLKPKDISVCLQYRMIDIKPDPDYCEFILEDVQKGGYLWIFPKGDDEANVGVGFQLNKITDKKMVRSYLDDFIKRHPDYSRGKVIEIVAGAVPVSAPIDKTVGDGILLVGDAARQVNPMTGGGIANACICGKIAGEVIGEAQKAQDFSCEFLNKYEKRWRKRLEDSLYLNYLTREKLVSTSNETINKIVRSLAEVQIEQLSTLEIIKVISKKHPELIEELSDLI
ncbi:MAG: NAD(P)/FAD-dependent oxidoreductase [Methanomassiliicoccales archaeon]|nr:MAG: NAD(P)/FAD-dependent oxidoreductase [Methanomassiliicoccales archaeon]